MPQHVFHGRSATLALQRSPAFRTPPATPGATLMPFHQSTFGRAPNRVEDPTMNGEALANKRDETDANVDGPLTSIFDLNTVGEWLCLLWGLPTTTAGTGDRYSHVFTLSLDERPSAMLEFAYNRERFHRFLGVMVNSLAWNVVDADQNLTINLVGGEEVKPRPSAAFDDNPSVIQKARACAKGGHVFDVEGASTLGDISGASVEITNDLEGQMLADNREGPGYFLLGQPAITGTLNGLFKGDGLTDIARNHETRPLSLVSKSAAGTERLTLRLPMAEFDEPKQTIQSSRGIVHEIGYRAYGVPGGDRPTITLENAVESYA